MFLMLQLQLNLCHPGRDNRRLKGAAGMMESTFLPEWEKLYSFVVVVVVVVVERNEKSFSLKCCCESVFSLQLNKSSKNTALFTLVKELAFQSRILSQFWSQILGCRWTSADGSAWTHADPRRHRWMTIFTSRIPEQILVDMQTWKV